MDVAWILLGMEGVNDDHDSPLGTRYATMQIIKVNTIIVGEEAPGVRLGVAVTLNETARASSIKGPYADRPGTRQRAGTTLSCKVATFERSGGGFSSCSVSYYK